jgi:hypothetical protein
MITKSTPPTTPPIMAPLLLEPLVNTYLVTWNTNLVTWNFSKDIHFKNDYIMIYDWKIDGSLKFYRTN